MDSNINYENIINSSVPLVIRGVLDWSQLKWTLKEWKTNLHEPDKKYPFRRGVYKCSKTPQWERTCQVVNLTIEDFFAQIEGIDENPQYWYYFDYKHLEQWFNHNISLKDISWSCLGLAEVPSPTIWIGSRGAHTPCHYDTYGHNLVAQLYGKKMWILFPPIMTDRLKPSRVPYEESSVYSNINFSCGCADISGISKVHCVVLEPGDILYVPKNWWHYVENVTAAISINTWLPKKCDEVSRLEESMAKCFITSVLRDMSQSERDHILNPNEDDLPGSINLEELTYCWKSAESLTGSNVEGQSVNDRLPPTVPVTCVSEVPSIKQTELEKILVEKCSTNKSTPEEKERNAQLDDVINAFCHPEVLTLARKKLQHILNSS